MPVPSPVTVEVPAKINLHLGVGPRRDDGYHELQTVFQSIGVVDELTAYPGPGLSVFIRGAEEDAVPNDATNLAIRAAALLAEHAGVDAAARLVIRKEIPVAGGMAGGSADAAAALIACDALWGTGLPRAELAELGAELGSDVPFCLQGGTALGTGRGEVLTPVLARGSYFWVVAIAAEGLSTAKVYEELDRRRGPDAVATAPDALLAALRDGDPHRLGEALHNDMQEAALALRPALEATLAAGRELGAIGALVSGSGPTCLFLARSRGAAIRIGAALTAENLCRTVRVVESPASGPRIRSG